MRWLLGVCLFLNVIPLAGAQQHKERRQMHEAIEKEKIAYLKKNLSLTASQEKAFWPVYDAQREAFAKLRRQRQLYAAGSFSLAEIEKLGDGDITRIVNNEMALRHKALTLEQAFVVRSRKILGDKKMARYYRLQEMFKHNLIERIRKEHEEKPH